MKKVMELAFILLIVMTVAVWAGGESEKEIPATAHGTTLINTLNPDFVFPTEPIKLVMWDFWEGERPNRIKYEREVAKQYQALHPNVTIEVVGVPNTSSATKFRTALESGTGADIMLNNILEVIDWGWDDQKDEPLYGDPVPDWLLNYMKEKLRPGALKQGSFVSPISGKKMFYGVVTMADNGLFLHYNKTFFDEAGLSGPPKTTKEMVEYAKKLTKYDAQGNMTRQGFAIRHSGQIRHIGYKAFPFFWAFTDGSKAPYLFTNDYLDTRIDSPPYIEAVKKYKSFVNELNISSTMFPDADESMASGLAAMSFRESFLWGRLSEIAPQYEFGVAPVPNGEPPYGNYEVGGEFAPYVVMLPVCKDEIKTAIAYDFLAFLQLTPEHDLGMARSQAITPMLKENMTSEYAKNLPVAKALAEYDDRPIMMSGLSPYGITEEVKNTYGQAISVIISEKDSDVEQVLKDTAEEIRTIIKRGVEASK